MSNFIVRNISGTGIFEIPSNDSELNAASSALEAILTGVADLEFASCLAQIVDPEQGPQELTCVVDGMEYDGSWFTTQIGLLRLAIEAELLSNANIDNIGNIDFSIVEPKPLYTYVPQVERVDNRTGIVYFKNEIPRGAQIEVYHYARRDRGQAHGHFDEHTRLGKRWRPDQLLPVGALLFDAGYYQKHPDRGRIHYRFAYRWPATPGTVAPAPGIRGPLSAFTISSANPRERTFGTKIVIVASPSGDGTTNS